MWQEAEHWQQNIYLRAHVLINKYVWNPYYVAGAGGREVAGGVTLSHCSQGSRAQCGIRWVSMRAVKRAWWDKEAS
jgi:hypothetical protein